MSDRTSEGSDSVEARIQRLVDPQFFEIDRYFFRDELRRGVRRFFWPLNRVARILQVWARPASRDRPLSGEGRSVVVPKPPRVKMRGYSIRKR